ncbi:unnamed protein product [Owenia fusiformis]|uniref:EGF-like domain-containing protein n=1 Tax=Owenia fusiformis TaxID=6347 RepID=A0A8S4PX96_OWEFU|nr:unnamed protein product [Owenia fusiformis]
MRLHSLTGLLTVLIAVFIEDTHAGSSCCQKTRQDLNTLATGISSDVATLTAGISTLTKMVSTLSNAISSIKTDVSDIKADNAGIEREIAALRKSNGQEFCDSTPCDNDGACNEYGYTCQCKSGYTGRNCETDIDECDSSPCQNKGNCTDQVNSYTCKCEAGYTGVNCETDIDECDPSPCQNEGTCIDKVNRYTCKCKAEFAGVNCTITIGQLKTKPIVAKIQLQSSLIDDLAVTSRGHIVAVGFTTKIYDSDFTLIKNVSNEFQYVAVSDDDQLVFTDLSRTIYFYTLDGSPIRNITAKVSPFQLNGITTLSTGQLVVCGVRTDGVYIVDQSTGNATTIPASDSFVWPNFVTTNSKGVVIVTDHSGPLKGMDQAGNVLFTYGAKTGNYWLGIITDNYSLSHTGCKVNITR